MTAAPTNWTGISPYTFHTIDPAITHLEQVLGAEGADSLFSRTYWRGRVLQALATPGLLSNQQQRLQTLLETIDASRTEIPVSKSERSIAQQIASGARTCRRSTPPPELLRSFHGRATSKPRAGCKCNYKRRKFQAIVLRQAPLRTIRTALHPHPYGLQ